ncbi:ABC transporter ATP-binding protein [Intestinibacter sp.]|uniref:ABC transporter ATP-binding protein n=1 Tax=Intestinibacter sp. TaxID=1965304 RepID=UPI002A757CCD|nr:ABC transporter ATP-binding protein [Intestinibacter sp.]MDY2734508.1 ABC transporter ATP-binding protein [Intestinibacter sp.]
MKKIISIFSVKEKIEYLCLVFGMLFGALLDMSSVMLIVPFINILSGTYRDEYGSFLGVIDINDTSEISNLGIFILLICITRGIFLPLLLKWQYLFVQKVEHRYAHDMFIFHLNKPYLQHIYSNSADFVRNMSISLPSVFIAVIMGHLQLFTEILCCIMICIFVFYVNFSVALAYSIFFAIMLVVTNICTKKKLIEKGEKNEVAQAEILKWLNQSVNNIKLTKIMHKERFFSMHFDEAFNKYLKATMSYQFISVLPRYIIETFVIFTLILLVLLGLELEYSPRDIFYLISAMAFAAFKIMPSVSRIIGINNSIKFYYPMFCTLYGELICCKQNLIKKDQRGDGNVDINFKSKIYIENISFSYSQSSNLILNNFSATIIQGTMVGIFGKSGSGKTTLIDILLGLLSPSNGNIFVDGRNIADSISKWQSKIAYVPQNVMLIDGSIYDNILLGEEKNEKNLLKVKDVLQKVDLLEYIDKQALGIETVVGENGACISGGQRQRIGIARALFQNKEVFILDEITSALDIETEKNIMKTLGKLKLDRTIISVTHSRNNMEFYDQCIYLD